MNAQSIILNDRYSSIPTSFRINRALLNKKNKEKKKQQRCIDYLVHQLHNSYRSKGLPAAMQCTRAGFWYNVISDFVMISDSKTFTSVFFLLEFAFPSKLFLFRNTIGINMLSTHPLNLTNIDALIYMFI